MKENVSQSSSVAVEYNGNQLDKYIQNPFSLNIDYLVINLQGGFKLPENEQIAEIKGFKFVKETYGTKNFKDRYTVSFENQSIGVMMCDPRSSILPKDFIQFQYENSLFYINPLPYLDSLTKRLCHSTRTKFTGVSRLDVAYDRENKNNFYQRLIRGVLNQTVLLGGKDKQIKPNYLSNKGVPELTGFYIGKRTSSRMLRCYCKTLELQAKPKEYIINKWAQSGLKNVNVWRYEYQLNRTFFKDLYDETKETLTYKIFEPAVLCELMKRAEKNHFEIKTNTGKAEINKEKTILLNCWDSICKQVSRFTATILKIKKIVEPSLLSQKRLLKAVFREYYQSKQNDLTHVMSLNSSLDSYPLKDWFMSKLDYYIEEFEKKSVQVYPFNKELFKEHSILSI